MFDRFHSNEVENDKVEESRNLKMKETTFTSRLPEFVKPKPIAYLRSAGLRALRNSGISRISDAIFFMSSLVCCLTGSAA